MFAKVKSNAHKKRQIKRFGSLFPTLEHFCTHTTLHGLKYVVDPDLHRLERLFWLALFLVFLIVASNVIYILGRQFQAAPTSVSIDSTNYKISGVPFPSVTVCPNDRIDWRKVSEVERRVLPNATTDATTIETFRLMLVKLSIITFGDFDELTFLKDRDLRGLAGKHVFGRLAGLHVAGDQAPCQEAALFLWEAMFSQGPFPTIGVNVTQLLRELTPSCEDMFSHCWWRNANRNCCDIFELQKTEYGFCYSFNSELAETARGISDEEPRPRRVSSYGDWSGVKVTIHLGNASKPPESDEKGGITLMISGPRVWPNSGTMMPAGSSLSVSLDCISGYATQRVLELDEIRIPCKYEETGIYNQETCISLCKRSYVIKYCGCNPSFLFPSTAHATNIDSIIEALNIYRVYELPYGQRECGVQDFLCLAEYNDIFNDYYVLTDESIVGKNPAMLCDCPPECEYYIYNSQIASVPIQRRDNIELDVHFAGQTSFRYKTDIVFTRLDLLVSFGSIIGLFLGGSLLSAVELIYYLMVVACYYLRSQCESKRMKKVRTRKPMVPVASTIPTLPILDYGPVKPRSKRIPSLLAYASVKSNFDRY